jgi:hypothetical protein
MKYPYLTDSRIAASAERLLADAFGNLDAVPAAVDLDVIIYDWLCEKEDLVFSDESDLGVDENGDEILGVTYPRAGRIEITSRLRSGPHLKGRYRFTVGHEVGHWVLHRPLFLGRDANLELFDPNAVSNWGGIISLSRNVHVFSGKDVPREEWQANRFAALLLINPIRLREEFERRFGEAPAVAIGQEGVEGLAGRLARSVTAGKPSLANEFDVSGEAMAVALLAREYVTEAPRLL